MSSPVTIPGSTLPPPHGGNGPCSLFSSSSFTGSRGSSFQSVTSPSSIQTTREQRIQEYLYDFLTRFTSLLDISGQLRDPKHNEIGLWGAFGRKSYPVRLFQVD